MNGIRVLRSDEQEVYSTKGKTLGLYRYSILITPLVHRSPLIHNTTFIIPTSSHVIEVYTACTVSEDSSPLRLPL
jgi:hypothetical protein